MISLENNPALKRNKQLEERLIPLILELEKESECEKEGHPNAEYQGIISSASGAFYHCPDCNCSIKRPLNQEQQKTWHDAMSVVYKSRA